MKNQEEYLKNKWFQRWVASEGDDEANKYWENWMKMNPHQVDELKESRDIIRSISFQKYKVSDEQIDSSWSEVQNNITEGYFNSLFRNGLKVAAVLTFLISSLIVFQYYSTDRSFNSFQENSSRYVVKHAEKGTKLTVQLSDGTKIKLNGGSKLIYPEVFCSDSREVELFGEGYFIVAHEKERPFIVKSGGISTTVLGTKFAVNAINPDQVQVALVSGKVKVENTKLSESDSKCMSLFLEPGMKAVYSDKCLYQTKIDAIMDLGWKDGIIAFENSSIDEVVSRLEQWYGVSIELKNSGKISNSFNGMYKNETLPNVLNSIAHSLNFTYKIKRNAVYIEGH
ncbi:FecR domain-containing protein [Reichenbachiella sp. MALMAid0571]|uniref:FecR family protein n=1 Tax=Reichenbachiella sp. MALMAid0571 TaxID=3143939 RepID=UPI0032E03A50